MHLLAKKSLSLLLSFFLLAPLIPVGPVSAAAPVGITTPGSTNYPGGQMSSRSRVPLSLSMDAAGNTMLDEAGGFLYTISQLPGTTSVLGKIRISDNTLVETTTVPNVDYAWTTAISADKKFVYIPDYCSAPTPQMHKISTETMEIVGTMNLPGTACITAMVLDDANNVGYIIDEDAPGTVFKFDLTTMAVLSSLTLERRRKLS